MARTLGKVLEPILGVPLPVSNKPGASGNAGITDLLAGKTDGYTMAVLIADTLCTLPAGQARYKFDDLEWIVRTQLAPSYLFVNNDSPFKTIQDLLEYTKKNPNKIKVGVTGFGTVEDMTVLYLGTKGYKMVVVPMPQPGERYAATLGGHNEVLYEQAGDVKQYIEAGQLRPLIIFAEKRSSAFPDVPCSKELGFPIYLPQFRCIVMKKGVAPERVKKIAEAVTKAVETPEWKKFAKEQYVAEDSFMGMEEFPKWARSEMEVMRKHLIEFGFIKP
jgi:tripartite-type tricarboxylate transporter receptor subunit TctC